MARQLNVAMIGAGFMGKAHSNAWRQVKMFFDLPVEPVMKVLCRKDSKGLAMADKYGWEQGSLDWKEVVRRPDIDIVDICTPNFLHKDLVLEAAATGKHIICEKPLANTLQDAKEMLAVVEKSGVNHLCNFSYRFAPAVGTIKRMIAGGELGSIYHFRSAYQQDWIVDPDFPMVWRFKKKHAGLGALGDIGAHSIDLCHYLLGNLAEVCGTKETFIKKRPVTESDTGMSGKSREKRAGKLGVVDVDDAVIFLGRLEGTNTLATFEATRFATGRRNHNAIEIYGSKGSVLWNQEDMNYFHYYDRNDPDHVQGFRRVNATDPAHPYASTWWPTGHIIGYEHLFTHAIYEFVSSIGKKKVDYPTFRDAVACQKVLDTLVKAFKSRKWEKVR